MAEVSDILKLVEGHRKLCFKKASCPLCKLPAIASDHISQCDYCGEGFDWRYNSVKEYWCICPRAQSKQLIICEDCVNIDHYEIIKEPIDGVGTYRGTYRAECCPMTKGI